MTSLSTTRHSVADLKHSDQLTIRVFQCIEKAETPWRELEPRADCWAFQTYDWIKTWHETVGRQASIKERIVLIESGEGQPLMILPLGVQRHRGISRLIWLGGALADYLGPVLCKGFGDRIDAAEFQVLWKSICSAIGKFDAVVLQRQPEMIAGQKNPFIFDGTEPHTCNAHSTGLASDLDSFLNEKRTASWRSKERRKERRLAEHGEIRFRLAKDASDVELILPDMFRQKGASYRNLGARDLFSESEYCDFVTSMSKQFLKGSFVYLCALFVGDRIQAAFWGLIYRRRFYHLLPSYEIDELTGYAPGNVLLRRMFDWAIAHEVENFDFTSGDDSYKSLWCDHEMSLYSYFDYRTFKGWLYVSPLAVQHRLKIIVKQSPLVLKLAQSIRAILNK